MEINKVINQKDKLVLSQTTEMTMESFQQPKSPFRTRITATDEFGDVLFDLEQNMVVLGGAISVLEKMWNVRSSLMIDTINNIMSINPAVQSPTTTLPADDYVCLWGIGCGGSGDAFGAVRDVKFYEREIGQNGQSTQMLPFRVVTAPLEGDDVQKYYLAKDLGNGYTAYYAKTFETAPFIRSLWRDGEEGEDGTEVTDGVHNTSRTEDIETFVEMHLKIEKADIREFFEMNGEIEKARVNTIGLFTAQRYVLPDGGYEYRNVKLFSKFNFDNEALSNRKSISFTYRIYAS